jgi:hypothetical protein
MLAATAVLTAMALIPTASLAAKKGTKAAMSPRSFNSCVELAKGRGFTQSDMMESTKPALRKFIMDCMSGKQM